MKTIENVTLYHCDFCSKTLRRKSDMSRHEQFCKKNPNNQHQCFLSCKYLKTDIDNYEDYGDGEYVPTIKSYECTLLKQQLYSYGAEKMKLPEKYPDDFEGKKRMPILCDSFEILPEYETKFNETIL